MKNKTSVIVITLLCALNAFLLYTNVERQNEINTLKSQANSQGEHWHQQNLSGNTALNVKFKTGELYPLTLFT